MGFRAMVRKPTEPLYSIAAASKLTGAGCHALRMWERRYGFPVPVRLPSGHRRYSLEQVEAIRTIVQRARTGRPIGELIADLEAGRLVLAGSEPGASPGSDDASRKLVDYLVAGDLGGGEAAYVGLTAGLTCSEVVGRIIAPAWIDVGERWYRRESPVFQERLVSEFLSRKLLSMIDAARRSNALPTHTIVVGTVQGDRHIGGALMLSLLLEGLGWRTINLGADLPVREYQDVLEHHRCNALALSFILSRNIRKRFEELHRIQGLPIFVGGRSILNYQALARRHGLIPLPGPIGTALPQLLAEYERWTSARASSSTTS
jgi:methanogenic corrinoid protein MtbC1